MSDDDPDTLYGTHGDPDVFSVPESSVTESLLERQSRRLWTLKFPPLEGLIGDCSGRRIWASEVDFLVAAVVSMLLVIALPDFDPLLKGLTFYVFFLLYFQLTEYFAGATPAKWWFGLRVRSVDGSKASLFQITVRTAMRAFEISPFFLGVFPAAVFIVLTRRHVRLGDMMAGTIVLRVENL